MTYACLRGTHLATVALFLALVLFIFLKFLKFVQQWLGLFPYTFHDKIEDGGNYVSGTWTGN